MSAGRLLVGRVRDQQLYHQPLADEENAFGYQTPYEEVFNKAPDLFLLRVWGCKSYIKLPKAYLRKDWRDKCYVGYLMGYSVEGEMG